MPPQKDNDGIHVIYYPIQPDLRPKRDRVYYTATRYVVPWNFAWPQDLRHIGWEPITINASFETDGASVPRILWGYIPPDGIHRAAALVHDYLYVVQGRLKHTYLTRAQCDKIFYNLLRHSGMSAARARIMFLAVRAFGGKVWRRW